MLRRRIQGLVMRIEVAGLDAAQAQIEGLPAKVERVALARMAQMVYDAAQRGADAHTKTGALRQSTYLRRIPGGWEVGHDPARAPHAVFVHWGTRAHVIKPKNRRALRFQPGGGACAFARKVQHPGYKGDAWLVRAAQDAARKMQDFVREVLEK